MHNRIPLARGLGSSAAATVGGLVAGNALAGRAAHERASCCGWRPRSRATPTTPPRRCSAGSSCRRRSTTRVEAIRFDAPRDLRAVLFIPELRLSTSEMRASCPTTVPLRRRRRQPAAGSPSGWPGSRPAASTCSAALTVDRLHEPYRAAVYPQLPRLVEAARERRGDRAPACRAPARRSSRSPTRSARSRRSRRRCRRPPPTPTCPAGSSRCRRATPVRRWSGDADPGGAGAVPDRCAMSGRYGPLDSAAIDARARLDPWTTSSAPSVTGSPAS